MALLDILIRVLSQSCFGNWFATHKHWAYFPSGRGALYAAAVSLEKAVGLPSRPVFNNISIPIFQSPLQQLFLLTHPTSLITF